MARRRMEAISEVVRRRRWREADARLVLRASQESGTSLSSFAREYGLQPARIWRWSARLREQASGSVLFHPVRLVGQGHGADGPGAIEVVLLDGRRVRVAGGFDTADLARVLAVLEGTVPC